MSRDSIHQRIDELLGLLSIHNSRLSLHTQKLSQLDIDVLRKQCIDLYDQVNMLALQGKIKSKVPVAAKVKSEPVVETTPEPKPMAKAEPAKIEEPKVIEEAPIDVEPPQEPKKSKPFVQETKPAPRPKAKVEDEMQSLFEKFSSTPLDSIAKGMSVAKRFEFQSAFFDGDHKEYNGFLSKLENAGTREAAFAIYHEYKNKLEWDNEDLKDELKALMYRKYA